MLFRVDENVPTILVAGIDSTRDPGRRLDVGLAGGAKGDSS